jgi:hypothetical protein
MVEFVVLGAALVVLGLYFLIRGTLPQWLPSGYVGQAGKRAELSRPVYRILGATSVLAGGATSGLVDAGVHHCHGAQRIGNL